MKFCTCGSNLLLYFIVSIATYPTCDPIEGDLDLSRPACDCLIDKNGGWLVYNNTYIRHFNSTTIDVSSLYTSEYTDHLVKTTCSLRKVDGRLYCPLSKFLYGKTSVTVTFRNKYNNTLRNKRWSKFWLKSSMLKYCDCDIGEIPSWKQLTWKRGKVSWKAPETKQFSLPIYAAVYLKQEGKYFTAADCKEVKKSDYGCTVSVESLAAYNKPFKVCLQPKTSRCLNESSKPVCSDEWRLQLYLLFERFAIKGDPECQRRENKLTLTWKVENQHEVFEAVALLVYRVSVRDNNGRLIYNTTVHSTSNSATHGYEITNFPRGINKPAYSFQVETCLTTGECSGKKIGKCPDNDKEEKGLGAYVIRVSIIAIIVVIAVIVGAFSFHYLKSNNKKPDQVSKKPTDSDEVFGTIYNTKSSINPLNIYAIADDVNPNIPNEEQFDHIEM